MTNTFVSRRVYLTDTNTNRIDWNKGNNVCILALNCILNVHLSFVLVHSCGAAYRLLVVTHDIHFLF